MHFSNATKKQDILFTCIEGQVIDVLIDIRIDSPTFKCYEINELKAGESGQIFIPAGVAHGFITHTTSSKVIYALTSSYDPKNEFTFKLPSNILSFDPYVKFTISKKDLTATSLNEMPLKYWPKL